MEKFTLETLNLLKNRILENKSKIGEELTEILIKEIDELTETANDLYDFEKLKEINLYYDEIYKIIALTYKEVKNVEKAKKLKKVGVSMENFEYELKNAIEHILETNYPRKAFWHFDDLIDDLKSGIKAGDDAVVIKNMVVNMEGPYPLKLGAKTALIHTACDVVAMGAEPKFALNAIQAKNDDEIKLAVDGLRKQSIGLNIPIVGGNTQTVEELKSCIAVAVFGELVDEKLIIRDGGAKEGDLLIMLGDPVEGDVGERVYKAKKKFDTYLEILKRGIKVNACKDASRGGWLGNLLEMLIKAKKGAEIKSLPYPRATRYLGSYILAVPEEEYEKILDIALKNKCPLVLFGRIIEDPKLVIGTKEYLSEEKMLELIKRFPYKPMGI